MFLPEMIYVFMLILNQFIAYDAEIIKLNILPKKSLVINSTLVEIITPTVCQFMMVYQQEVSRLKIDPVFSQDRVTEKLLSTATQNNTLIFDKLLKRGICCDFSFKSQTIGE